MTICLIDLGNTRYKWIAKPLSSTSCQRRQRYDPSDPKGRLCAEIMADCGCRNWVVASVKGEAFDRELTQRFLDGGGERIRFVTVPTSPPFPLAYENTGKFGIDRYLNLLAARDEYELPLLVVDAGTAVTIDALDRRGAHLGGVIFPGLALLRSSLTGGTGRVTADATAEALLFGNTTESCVNGGVLYGLQGAMTGIVELMRKRLGGHATILLTGGDAERLAPAFPPDTLLDHNLLLKGLGKV